MVVRKSKKEEAERRRREQQRIFVEGLQRYKSKGIQILIVELVRQVIIEISRKKDICYLSQTQSGKRVNLC